MALPLHYDARRGIRQWGGLGNLYKSDCTVAAYEHIQMVHNLATASSWKKLLYRIGYVIPTTALTLEEYDEVLASLGENPASDPGVYPNTLLAWAEVKGKIKTWTQLPITVDAATTIKEAVVAWDGCIVALELTSRAYYIGNAPGEWVLDAGDKPQVNLAHAVGAVEYGPKAIGVTTWGIMKNMTYEFANATVYGVWVFN